MYAGVDSDDDDEDYYNDNLRTPDSNTEDPPTPDSISSVSSNDDMSKLDSDIDDESPLPDEDVVEDQAEDLDSVEDQADHLDLVEDQADHIDLVEDQADNVDLVEDEADDIDLVEDEADEVDFVEDEVEDEADDVDFVEDEVEDEADDVDFVEDEVDDIDLVEDQAEDVDLVQEQAEDVDLVEAEIEVEGIDLFEDQPEDFDEEDHPQDEMMDYGLENGNDNEELEMDNYQNPNHPVTAFRQVTDAAGNISYEFVFNSSAQEEVNRPINVSPPRIEDSVNDQNILEDADSVAEAIDDFRGSIEGLIARPPSPDEAWHNFLAGRRNLNPRPGPSRPRTRNRNSAAVPQTRRRKRPAGGKAKHARTPKRANKAKKSRPTKPLKPINLCVEQNGCGDKQEFESMIAVETVCPIGIDLSGNDAELNGPKIKLGSANIIFHENVIHSNISDMFPDLKEVTLYVSTIPGRSVFVVKTERELSLEESIEMGLQIRLKERAINNTLVKSFYYHCFLDGIPLNSFDKVKYKKFNKSFSIVVREEQPSQIVLDVYVLASEVLGEHTLAEIPVKKPPMVLKICDFFLKLENPGEKTLKTVDDIHWFYGQIKKYHHQEILPKFDDSVIQHCGLVPKLRSYQKQAVNWMLYREGYVNIQPEKEMQDIFKEKMYINVSIVDWKGFYNPYIGYFCSSRPEITSLPSGGILADEMGLGKTVEMLALILINRKPGTVMKMEGKIPEDDITDLVYNDELLKHPKLRNKRGGSPCEMFNNQPIELGEDKPPTVTRKSRKGRARNLGLSKVKKRKKQNRSPSPDEEETADSVKEEENNSEYQDRSNSQSHLLIQSLQSGKRRRTRATARNSGENNDDIIIIKTEAKNNVQCAPSEIDMPETSGRNRKPKAGDNLKLLQSLYSATLSGFDGTADAKIKPKFHGKFYETSLDSKAYFECVCGGFADTGQKVLTCRKCSSSQHAECVGEHLVDRPAKMYVCPHCTISEEIYDANATLIITPSSISYQWISEIQQHVNKTNKSLNILFYKGVGKHGYIPPARLASYDIVITTYSVLQSEINYVDLPHNNSEEGRKFRNPKRFLTIPSPLPCVNWWRICLDEAQMVEGIHARMSQMAKKLKSVHRWCISGTPVNKGLQDLFGLFSFLDVVPIVDEFWWTHLVHDAFYRKEVGILYELFGRMIWRTGKADVLEQLGIPPQTEKTHWLCFSAIESHFYKEQYETCSSSLLHKVSKLDSSISEITKLSSLDRRTIQNLLQPFLELRQACCHPQMVKGQLLSLNRGTLTMAELLEQLIKKSSITCAEDHRIVVGALNGLAGLHILKSEMREASEMYRQVLQSAEKYKEHFPTDTLQLMHTMDNLADIIDGNYGGVPFTLRDDNLRTEVEQLKTKYLEKYQSGVTTASSTLAPLTKAVEELFEGFNCKKETWWVKVLERAAHVGKLSDLINRIKSDLLESTDRKNKSITAKSIAHKFHDAFSLQNILVENLTTLENCRLAVLKSVETLQTHNPASLVDGAVGCHLRSQSQLYYNDSTSAKCILCAYHQKLIDFESILFWEETKANVIRTGRKWQQNKMMGNLADNLTQEEKEIALMREHEELFESTDHVQLFAKACEKSWKDSETEKTLKVLAGFSRLNGCPLRVIEDATQHNKLFQAMKKEYKFIRILFRQIFDQVAAVDELNQATTRLRLRYEGEEVKVENVPQSKKALSSGFSQRVQKLMNVHVVDKCEINDRMVQMRSDSETAAQDLAMHLGQLMYLKSLKTQDYGKKGSFNTEECPICQNPLGTKWTVFLCGHSFCQECVQTISSGLATSFACPLCRVWLKKSEISIVHTEEEANSEGVTYQRPELQREIIGSHSTKVEAVVVQLIKLQETHPGEKVLVFSNWADVLEILSRAFDQNEIKYCTLSQSGYQKVLQRFKTREDIQVLLMPLSFGAKGLNLIEATHVFLVEPVLNKASELQAIGRVHRIGQTRPTVVHRFYIKNTIEEKLFEILNNHDITADEEGSLTIKDLKSMVSK